MSFSAQFSANTVLKGPDVNPSTHFTEPIRQHRLSLSDGIANGTVGETFARELGGKVLNPPAVEFGRGANFDRFS